MISVVEAIHAMVGSFFQMPDDDDSPEKRVDKIFDQMDMVSFNFYLHLSIISLYYKLFFLIIIFLNDSPISNFILNYSPFFLSSLFYSFYIIPFPSFLTFFFLLPNCF